VKPLIWLGSSLDDIRRFSSQARQAVGYQLFRVQNGLEPSDWKPMATVGAGVAEIRIHADREHRVLYVARFGEAVYVLHAFIKKTPKTSKRDLEMASRRFRELQKLRRGER
jgi:phage-related protein